jgi:hypothetical protein
MQRCYGFEALLELLSQQSFMNLDDKFEAAEKMESRFRVDYLERGRPSYSQLQ